MCGVRCVVFANCCVLVVDWCCDASLFAVGRLSFVGSCALLLVACCLVFGVSWSLFVAL